jgi:hypothetical protein
MASHLEQQMTDFVRHDQAQDEASRARDVWHQFRSPVERNVSDVGWYIGETDGLAYDSRLRSKAA